MVECFWVFFNTKLFTGMLLYYVGMIFLLHTPLEWKKTPLLPGGTAMYWVLTMTHKLGVLSFTLSLLLVKSEEMVRRHREEPTAKSDSWSTKLV